MNGDSENTFQDGGGPETDAEQDNGTRAEAEPKKRMKEYSGAKILQAEPMTSAGFKVDQGESSGAPEGSNPQPSRPGYKVRYPDGYVSWSPKEVFEIAYREVTRAERALFE